MALNDLVRRRVRNPNRVLDLNYFESRASILNEQRKVSQVLVEEGDLFLQ